MAGACFFSPFFSSPFFRNRHLLKNPTATQATLCRTESWDFYEPVVDFLCDMQGKLTGRVSINTVKKVISIVEKDKIV
jgi:hypothetical protein